MLKCLASGHHRAKNRVKTNNFTIAVMLTNTLSLYNETINVSKDYLRGYYIRYMSDTRRMRQFVA